MSLRSSLDRISAAIDSDRVPSRIRPSIELVQVCHRDLQHLIELRNAQLPFLEAYPHLLGRVNCVIKTAKESLAPASHIVERCHAGAQLGGKTHLLRRLGWLLSDSAQFRGQEPIIHSHHAAVLAEVGFLRQVSLRSLPLTSETLQPRQKTGKVSTASLDNLELLDDIMGTNSPSVSSSQEFTLRGTSLSSMPFAEYSSLPQPCLPNMALDLSPNSEIVSRISSSWILPSQDGTNVKGMTLSAADSLGLSVLLDDDAEDLPRVHLVPGTAPLNSSVLSAPSFSQLTSSMSSISLVTDLPDESLQQNSIEGPSRSNEPQEMEGSHNPN